MFSFAHGTVEIPLPRLLGMLKLARYVGVALPVLSFLNPLVTVNSLAVCSITPEFTIN